MSARPYVKAFFSWPLEPPRDLFQYLPILLGDHCGGSPRKVSNRPGCWFVPWGGRRFARGAWGRQPPPAAIGMPEKSGTARGSVVANQNLRPTAVPLSFAGIKWLPMDSSLQRPRVRAFGTAPVQIWCEIIFLPAASMPFAQRDIADNSGGKFQPAVKRQQAGNFLLLIHHFRIHNR